MSSFLAFAKLVFSAHFLGFVGGFGGVLDDFKSGLEDRFGLLGLMHGKEGDSLANNSLDVGGVVPEGLGNFGELVLKLEFVILVGRLFACHKVIT